MHQARIFGEGLHAFQVQVAAGKDAAHIGAVGELAALLAVKLQRHLIHRGKAGERVGDGVHHQAFLPGVNAVERLLADVDVGAPFADVDIKGGAFRNDRAQAQPCSLHVVFRILDHQRKRGLGDAVGLGHLARHGHQIAVTVLIEYHGGYRVLLSDGLLDGNRRLLHQHLRGGLVVAAQGQHHHQRRRAQNQDTLDIGPFDLHASSTPHAVIALKGYAPAIGSMTDRRA